MTFDCRNFTSEKDLSNRMVLLPTALESSTRFHDKLLFLIVTFCHSDDILHTDHMISF